MNFVSSLMRQQYLGRRRLEIEILQKSIIENNILTFNKIGHQVIGNVKSYGFKNYIQAENIAHRMEQLKLIDLQVMGAEIIKDYSIWIEQNIANDEIL